LASQPEHMCTVLAWMLMLKSFLLYIEQEHIVEELQKENIRLEAKYTRLGAIILFVSMAL
jgi:hypothetical protein